MNTHEKDVEIRRIMVALDASPHSYAALEAAIRMAAQFKAELMGVYVEDINILRLAEHPFVREVGLYSCTSRRINIHNLERQLRTRTLEIQRRFVNLTTRQQIQQNFRVIRGKVTAEIHTAASKADVLIVGKAGWSQLHHRRLGSTARAASADDTPGVTMILEQGTQLSSPFLVVYDGSSAAERALSIAATLTQAQQGSLNILFLADSLEEASEQRVQSRKRLNESLSFGHERILIEPNLSTLTLELKREVFGTLVIPARIAAIEKEPLLNLLEEVAVPILLVR